MLRDIAILTGGQVVSEELGMNIRDFQLEWFGKAKSVKVQKENTIIVNGAGNPQEIKDRVESIKKQIEVTTSNYDKEKLNERLAKLAGGVGDPCRCCTETKLKEKKYRGRCSECNEGGRRGRNCPWRRNSLHQCNSGSGETGAYPAWG